MFNTQTILYATYMVTHGKLLNTAVRENKDVPSRDPNYNYEGRIETTMESARKNFSIENYEILSDYLDYMVRKPKALATRSKTVQTLFTMTKIFKESVKPKGVEKAWGIRDVNSRSGWALAITSSEVNEMIRDVMEYYCQHNGGKETNTSADMKKLTRLFLRWVALGTSDLPKNQPEVEEVMGISIGKVNDRIAITNIPNDADIEKILAASGRNPRNIALIKTHSEAGTRESELLSMRICDFIPQKNGALIRVHGKTGARRIQVVRCVPSLLQYLATHPYRDDPDAPFWIQVDANDFGKTLTYHAMRGVFKRAQRKAGVKDFTLHSYRHYAATTAAKFMPESMMRKRFGWSRESKQPTRYTHLNNTDANNMYLKANGVEIEEEPKPEPPISCMVCKFQNEPGSIKCMSCGQPLNVEGLQSLESEEMKNINDKLAWIMSQMEVKKIDDPVQAEFYKKQHISRGIKNE